MKAKQYLATMIWFMLAASAARAGTIVLDDFSAYDSSANSYGQSLNGQSASVSGYDGAWYGPYGADDDPADPTARFQLVTPEQVARVGKRGNLSADGYIQRNLAAGGTNVPETSEFWLSATMRCDVLHADQANPVWVAMVMGSNATFAGFGFKQDGGVVRPWAAYGTIGNGEYGAGMYTLGDTVRFVARLEKDIDGWGSEERLTVWLDPAGPTSTLFAVLDSWNLLSSHRELEAVRLHAPTTYAVSDGTVRAYDYTVGEVAVGGTYWSVVPEPATMALLGLGSLALIRCRRKETFRQ